MAYVEIWTWKTTTEPKDLTGYDVEATDGHIGKVDEATYEAGNSCLVVDTGWWIFGKKRMLPAGAVERVDDEERKLYLGCAKEQVKDAPDYDEDERDEPAYRDKIGDYWSGQ